MANNNQVEWCLTVARGWRVHYLPWKTNCWHREWKFCREKSTIVILWQAVFSVNTAAYEYCYQTIKRHSNMFRLRFGHLQTILKQKIMYTCMWNGLKIGTCCCVMWWSNSTSTSSCADSTEVPLRSATLAHHRRTSSKQLYVSSYFMAKNWASVLSGGKNTSRYSIDF